MHKLEGLAPRRKTLGLSQSALAELVGVTRQAICNWERGFSWPMAYTLPDLAGALCCSVDDLFHAPEVDPSVNAESGGDSSPCMGAAPEARADDIRSCG